MDSRFQLIQTLPTFWRHGFRFQEFIFLGFVDSRQTYGSLMFGSHEHLASVLKSILFFHRNAPHIYGMAPQLWKPLTASIFLEAANI